MSNDSAPLISVIVRTQNRPRLLSKALASLAAQTYQPVQAVVINDGGEDVAALVEPFKTQLSGGLTLLQHDTAQGRSAAANAGIEAAQGEWLAFLDDDDVFLPDGLAQLAAFIPWDKQVIYGQVRVVRMSDGVEQGTLGGPYDPNSLLFGNIVPICGFICRRDLALKVGGFDTDFDYLEDWEFFYRLTRQIAVHFTAELVSSYCIWGEAHISGKNQTQELQYRQRFFAKHSVSFTPEQLAAATLGSIRKQNRDIGDARAYCETLLEQKDAEKQKAINEMNARLCEALQNYDRTYTQLRSEKEQLRQEGEQHFQQRLNHHLDALNYQWRRRVEGVMRKISLNMAFDLRSEVVDLPSFGLSIPMQALEADKLSITEVIPEYAAVKFPMPVTQGKTLRWALLWNRPEPTASVLIRLGTYDRVNQCHLVLTLTPIDTPEATPIYAQFNGAHVQDNEYNSFALSRPLQAGRYICELHSPDTDNSNHLLGVWLSTHHRKTEHQVMPHYNYAPPNRGALEAALSDLRETPLFSLIVPVYNPDKLYLKACLDSVLKQVYPHWELCLCDDASTQPYVREILEDYCQRYPDKIKLHYNATNQHISITSNNALALASGEFIALLDHDDLLTEDALFEMACMLNHNPNYDVIYSDEDKWDGLNYCFDEPYFKPDWAPELLRGQMYLGHLGVYRKKLVDEVGGFRVGFEGSQDWDLALRVTEQARVVGHVPKILYHWRKHAESTAASMGAKNYAVKAGLKAVQAALDREGANGKAEMIAANSSRALVRYPAVGEPLVSIIIPTRDQPALLKACINSLIERNSYSHWELVIVDNNSEEAATFELFADLEQRLGKNRFRVCSVPGVFNFSRLVNLGVKAAQGEIIFLLNNDTEVIRPDTWLEDMVGYALRPGIGCIGCKLLYADNTFQHAGLIAGVHDVAGHAYRFAPQEHQGYLGHLGVVSNFIGTTAAALMIRREIWDAIGGFDETLAVAFNDVDFCFRVIAAGYRNIIMPQVYFYHYESKSRGVDTSPERRARFLQEYHTILGRWSDSILPHDPYYSPHLSRHHEDFRLSEDSPYYDKNELLFDWRDITEV